MSETIFKEGFLNVPGGKIAFSVYGNPAAAPLIVVHGGPGFPHNYLLPLRRLAGERQVVFYDQLGCGKSERPFDPALWNVNRFVFELQILCEELSLKKACILGHSWGSIVGFEYYLSRPDAVEALIFASPCLSIPRWIRDSIKLRGKLPWSVRRRLSRGEASGDFQSAEYLSAMNEYYLRFVNGPSGEHPLLKESRAGFGGAAYHTMWGPNEFQVSGTLRHYDRTSHLGRIAVPTLYTCGKNDEATPKTTKALASLTPGAEIAVFRRSAHMPHLTEEDLYISTVEAFLRKRLTA